MGFSEKSTLEEILEFPEAETVLIKYKVPCLGCLMAKMEMGSLALGQICATYGIDCPKLLADLNAVAAKCKK